MSLKVLDVGRATLRMIAGTFASLFDLELRAPAQAVSSQDIQCAERSQIAHGHCVESAPPILDAISEPLIGLCQRFDRLLHREIFKA